MNFVIKNLKKNMKYSPQTAEFTTCAALNLDQSIFSFRDISVTGLTELPTQSVLAEGVYWGLALSGSVLLAKDFYTRIQYVKS